MARPISGQFLVRPSNDIDRVRCSTYLVSSLQHNIKRCIVRSSGTYTYIDVCCTVPYLPYRITVTESGDYYLVHPSTSPSSRQASHCLNPPASFVFTVAWILANLLRLSRLSNSILTARQSTWESLLPHCHPLCRPTERPGILDRVTETGFGES